MGIQVCENQGVSPFWGPVRGYSRGHFGCLKDEPLARMQFIFGMEYSFVPGDSSLHK